ncbi:unnamed protein product, partial [Staurois parvus]
MFARCQNSLPELLFGCKLPPTLIDLLLEDAPKVLNRIEVRGGWRPHHDLLSFYPHSSHWRCIVLPSVPGKKVVSHKLHILCRGH